MAQSRNTMHIDYKPAGLILFFPFQKAKIYTDTSAITFVCNHEQDSAFKKYFLRIKNLISSLSAKTINDTLLFPGNDIPFQDSLTGVYPTSWYIDLTIFEIIGSGKIKITDSDGNEVNTLLIKIPGKQPADHHTTVYLNKATKKELFRKTLYTEQLNLIH